MKNFLLTLIFTLSSTYMYSQEVNFGLSLGTGLSNQTLQSSNSPYTAGQTWNTIGGLPYRVDPYLGYNAGLMIELFFDLSTTDIDEKVKKSKIGIKSTKTSGWSNNRNNISQILGERCDAPLLSALCQDGYRFVLLKYLHAPAFPELILNQLHLQVDV